MARQFRCPVCDGQSVVFPIRRCVNSHPSFKKFQLSDVNDPWAEEASRVAQEVDKALIRMSDLPDFHSANALGASSRHIQDLLTPSLLELGFVSERSSKSGLAEFRPDFTKTASKGGILVEIERGKTLDNNMDMLDLWKTHIHPEASHLILIVPVWYVTTNTVRSTFSSVCRRMQPFFFEENRTNVKTLHVIGY